jgi:hypothetical protein
MFNHDLGAALYATWSDEQRREEIGKLVAGYRNGLPLGILCTMAETIAGNHGAAREHLAAHMTQEERQTAVDRESDSIRLIAAPLLL